MRIFSTPVFLRTTTGTAIPFDVWYEEGSAGRTREWAGKSLTSAHSRLEYLTNLTEAELQKSGHCHVRCDLIELKNDGCLFVLTWRHIILGGVGAERGTVPSGDQSCYLLECGLPCVRENCWLTSSQCRLCQPQILATRWQITSGA
jgi:hypothetical protein